MTADFFTRLAGRTLGKVSVVQPDILPIFAGNTLHESEKMPPGYQEGRLYLAEDNEIPSSFFSAEPRVNMINITLPEPSDINRCKVQDEATASPIYTESKKATSKTRQTSSFYPLSKSEHAESPGRKIPTISKSPPPNFMDGKNLYNLPEDESRKRADVLHEGIPTSLQSTGIMASNDIPHEDKKDSHTGNYSKVEIFTGYEAPSVSSLVADSARVQEKDKKLLLNSTDINENKKNNRSHLATYSADAENREIILPPAGEVTIDMHVAARPQDNEKVYSLRGKISENLEDWPVETPYSTGAQSSETITALDDNSINGIRKLAQSPIPQEQLIHINIGRIYVKASLPQGHNEERHKVVKRDPPLSLDEYLKRRSGGSYE